MNTHCLHCNGRQATRGTGRIDSITRVKKDLAWIVWKCQNCALVWSTPITTPDAVGNAIAEHMLALTTPQQQNTALVKYDQGFADKQVSKSHECKHSLPKDLCTICPTSFGVGRVT